jgi:hypothetical protein
VPPSSLAWDAWRRDDGKWTVSLSYHSGEHERVAHFVYDPLSRVVVTGDDESRWLAGEPGPLKGPQPRIGGRTNRPDDERAVELANEGRALRLAPIESDDEADRTTGDPELFDGPFRRNPAVRPVIDLPADVADPEDDAPTASLPRVEPDDLGPDEWVDLDEAQAAELEDVSADADETPAGVGETAKSEVATEADEADPEMSEPDVAEPEVAEPERPVAKSGRKGKRAAVPSWDDILFGTRNDGS